MKICEYGCGEKAKHQFKNGKWCCSLHRMKCLAVIESVTGEKNHFYGRKHSKQTKNAMSIKKKEEKYIPWNKGLKGHFKHKEESKRKMSEIRKGNTIPWNTGRKMSKEFCNKRSEYTKGENNPFWKGGYCKENIPIYDTYAKQLTVEEDPQRDENDRNILNIQCANSKCRKRFVPKLSSVHERVKALKGKINGELRLYCSDECKKSCSIYWKKESEFLHKENDINYTQSEYKQFREHVLERDEYLCQYCGKEAEHVHHERPQKLEPFHALDPDFAWSCCEKCHYEKGYKDKCSTGVLSHKIC